jgi:hypothetical protein
MKQYKDTQYYVTDNGDILNKKNKIKSFVISNAGYKRVCLSINGKQTMRTIHRIVAETYIPNTLNKQMVNHKDGDKLNNNINNLEWVDRAENEYHAKINKLKASKERHGMAKLNQNDVNWIRDNYKSRDKQFGRKAMADKLGVTPQLIGYVLNKKIWK